jgi:hypothetical protein
MAYRLHIKPPTLKSGGTIQHEREKNKSSESFSIKKTSDLTLRESSFSRFWGASPWQKENLLWVIHAPELRKWWRTRFWTNGTYATKCKSSIHVNTRGGFFSSPQ